MKKAPFHYHFLFWLSIYLLWVLLFRSYSVPLTKTLSVEFCYLLFITLDYYVLRALFFPPFVLKKNYGLFIPVILLLIAGSALLRALVSVYINQHVFHTPVTDFSTLYLTSALNISFWVLLITVGTLLLDTRQRQRQLEQLEKERLNNELDFLKAQINPHALFNSLNTIYGHIDKQNQVAKNTLLQFSELLRYQLYDCSAERVHLEQELAYLRKYVSFQQLRKEQNLVVALDIDAPPAELRIVPLLLVVPVENAFKYVSGFSDRKNTIGIQIRLEGTVLSFVCTNTTDTSLPLPDTHSGGIGLRNLKRRLELVYAGTYTFTTAAEKDIYTARLTIDLS